MTCFVLLPVPALAGPEPVLVELYPPDGFHVSTPNAEEIRAVFDRDLVDGASKLWVAPGTTPPFTPVAGDKYLCGDLSPTGGLRAICFRPTVPLGESPYTARAEAAPASSPATTTVVVWQFTVDNTAPGIPTVTSPTGGVVTEHPVVARGTAEAGAEILVVEGGDVIARDHAANTGAPTGAFSVFLPYPPEDGVSHTIQVFARDQAQNTGLPAGPFTFVHDSVVRIPEILSPTEAQCIPSTTVPIRGTAKPNTTVTIKEGATTVATTLANANGDWSTSSTFAVGPHSVTATSFDGTFNDGPSPARAFSVDLTAPSSPTIQSPAFDGEVFSSRDVPFSGLAEPLSTVEIRKSGLLMGTAATNAAGAWSTTIRFTQGTHAIEAAAVDCAGNASTPAARTFIVDTAAPVRPVISTPAEQAFVATSNVTVAGTAEQLSNVEIRRGNVTIGMATANGVGAWSVVITFPDGAHTVEAVAIDGGGNESSRSAPRSFTVDTQTPAAPVITNPTEGATVATNQVPVGGTAEPGTTIRVFEGTALKATTSTGSAGTWAATITFPNGTHTVTATAQDYAGNLSGASTPRSFIVSSTADATSPTPPIILTPREGTLHPRHVRVSGTAEPHTVIRIFEVGLLGSATATAAGTWEAGIALTTGEHTIYATATDAAGNISVDSDPRTFIVDGERPEILITSPPDGAIFLPGETVFLEGAAHDDRAVAFVEVEVFGITGARVTLFRAQECSGCGGIAATWRASVQLTPGIYRIEARAVDGAGNRSDEDSLSIIHL